MSDKWFDFCLCFVLCCVGLLALSFIAAMVFMLVKYGGMT